MKITGNTKSIGLGDVFQIIGFSHKSGTLKLISQRGEGSIIFKNGKIIRAASSVIKEGVCHLLVKNGIMTPEQIRKAKALQISGGFTKSLGTTLEKDLHVFPVFVEETAISQVENIVLSLFLWPDADFSFELGYFAETPAMLRSDPLHYTLVNGIDAHYLAMEGTRLRDEFKRDGAVHEGFPIEIAPEDIVPAPHQVIVLIVDDDPFIRGMLRHQLVQKGFKASAFGLSEVLLSKIEELVKRQECPVVVADMLMPTIDGEGMHGGMELLAHLKKDFSDIPVIIITERQDDKMEKEAMDLGAYACLLKPKKLQFEEGMASFVEELIKTMDELSENGAVFEEEELRKHFEEAKNAESKSEESKGFTFLKNMLSELGKPLSIGEIILLILRFGSSITNRAVLFAVKEDGIIGLGQFGVESKGEIKRGKKMRIPLNEPSILKEAIDGKIPILKRFDPCTWNNYILDKLGGYKPAEAFAAPVIVQGKVTMVFYGDNVPKEDKIRDTSALEIFLAQASIALERTILEKKLFETGALPNSCLKS